MKPGTLFYRRQNKGGRKERKKWKRIRIEGDDLVHIGPQLHMIVQGQKAQKTEFRRLACDATRYTNVVTEDPVTCLVCLGRLF